MVFSDYTKKRILFYDARGLHARSHHTHAHTLLSLRVLFAPVPSDSRSTALQVMASTLDRAQLLDYTRAGVWLFEIRDRYLRCTRIKFNCNMRVVRTYVKQNGPCTVRSASVRGPFNSRLTSVFLKRSSVKRTVQGRFFGAYRMVVCT